MRLSAAVERIYLTCVTLVMTDKWVTLEAPAEGITTQDIMSRSLSEAAVSVIGHSRCVF